MIIYKATNKINNKCYIGQTKGNLNLRIKEHLKTRKKGVFHIELEKYGKENFKWCILEFCYSQEELNQKEKWYIKHFNSFGKNGYNMTSGGEVFEHSEETKEKIRNSIKGRKLSEETKNKISLSLIGNKYMVGKKLSDETKKKLSEKGKGRYYSKETRKKIYK